MSRLWGLRRSEVGYLAPLSQQGRAQLSPTMERTGSLPRAVSQQTLAEPNHVSGRCTVNANEMNPCFRTPRSDIFFQLELWPEQRGHRARSHSKDTGLKPRVSLQPSKRSPEEPRRKHPVL